MCIQEVGLRRSLCISTASSAFLVKADASKTHFEDVRIAFGAIGPVPRRMMEIEDRLKGEVISKGLIQKMEEYIPEDVVRSRSRKEYRRNVVKNFTLAGIYEAFLAFPYQLRTLMPLSFCLLHPPFLHRILLFSL